MITKYILSLFLFASLDARCQAPATVQRIEFISLARGYEEHVVLTPDSLVKTIESRLDSHEPSYKRKLSKEEWAMLTESLKNVTLADIPGLQSPSMKRTYDGARHSSLNITTKDQTVLTHSFDDEDPNEKLMPLMKVIHHIEAKDQKR
jgi:hypothetical protein